MQRSYRIDMLSDFRHNNVRTILFERPSSISPTDVTSGIQSAAWKLLLLIYYPSWHSLRLFSRLVLLSNGGGKDINHTSTVQQLEGVKLITAKSSQRPFPRGYYSIF